MKIGYAYAASNAPPLKDQHAALKDEGCKEIWTDEHPNRGDREIVLESDATRPGDTLVICKPSIIGNGAKDTANAVRTLGAKNVAIQVIGCGAKVYTDEGDIRDFAAVALKVSRQAVARNMLAKRQTEGRPRKWDPDASEITFWRIFWHDRRVPLGRIIEAVSYTAGRPVSRENITARLGNRGDDPRDTE